jgi:pimeloyl-ACP methyl ester carboxylesterase
VPDYLDGLADELADVFATFRYTQRGTPPRAAARRSRSKQPERLLGVVCVDPLPAFADVLAELNANLRRGLSPEEIARLDEIEARRLAGKVTEGELLERFALIWPQFFLDPSPALPSPPHVGVEASIGTNRSLAEHFERGTLVHGLPNAELPVLFVHGAHSAMPLRATVETCALVARAELVVVAECGHFPWIEQPGSIRGAVESFLAIAR